MLRLLLFGVLFVVFGQAVQAQSSTVTIKYNDPRIEQTMQRYALLNQQKQTLPGWRVQVFATTDRAAMETFLATFKSKYPEVYVEWAHQKPYYRVLAGAFTKKFDAYLLSIYLREGYPSAFLMQDPNIKQAELIKH
jgi:SPOR domain